jgi:DnaJ-class molecular chaperone
MAKLKKSRVHKAICDNCKGNGYIKLRMESPKEEQIHQCWICDSEGEIYVYESKMVPSSDAGNDSSSSTQLH